MSAREVSGQTGASQCWIVLAERTGIGSFSPASSGAMTLQSCRTNFKFGVKLLLAGFAASCLIRWHLLLATHAGQIARVEMWPPVQHVATEIDLLPGRISRLQSWRAGLRVAASAEVRYGQDAKLTQMVVTAGACTTRIHIISWDTIPCHSFKPSCEIP